MEAPARIAIADAQDLVRAGIKFVLQDLENVDIRCEAASEEELLDCLSQVEVDIIILDYNHPDQFSVNSLPRIREVAPHSRLLIISADDDKNRIDQVLQFGVNSYLTKTCDEQEIKDAIRATYKDEKFFCTKVVDYLLERSYAKLDENCAPTPLSPREIEIVQLIAKGFIAKEIADLLNLSPHTVYTHRKNVMKKLQLSSSSELLMYAVNNGLVSTEAY
ncbi:MAG: response regulator transcription factor [Lewinella sp.]|nr:response regulator transcription factor [Lewinella sp.]